MLREDTYGDSYNTKKFLQDNKLDKDIRQEPLDLISHHNQNLERWEVTATRVAHLGTKWVKFAQNGTNPGISSDQIQYILALAKIYWILIWNSSQNVLKSDLGNLQFVPCLTNLTHFHSESDIPVLALHHLDLLQSTEALLISYQRD